MKLPGALRIFVTVACSLFLAGPVKISRLAAQNEPATQQESVESLQITANDEIAAEDIAGHHIHLHPLRSHAAVRGRCEDTEVRRGNPHQESSENESAPSISAASTVPGLPFPGFYPADLSNATHGKVLTAVQSDNVYVNGAATCWGTPVNFLGRLALSNFIQVGRPIFCSSCTPRPARRVRGKVTSTTSSWAAAWMCAPQRMCAIRLTIIPHSSSARIAEQRISRISAMFSIRWSPSRMSQVAR